MVIFPWGMLNYQRVTGHSTKAYLLWPFCDIFCEILESHLIIGQNCKFIFQDKIGHSRTKWKYLHIYTEHFPMSQSGVYIYIVYYCIYIYTPYYVYNIVPMPEMPHVFSESSRRLPLPVRCCGRIRFQWPRWGARQLWQLWHLFANTWVCLKIGYIPNEIAIFHRDKDQQNHWV